MEKERADELFKLGNSPEDIGIALLKNGEPYDNVVTTLTDLVESPAVITVTNTAETSTTEISFPFLTKEIDNQL